MADGSPVQLEHAVSRQQAQHPSEGIAVGADDCGQLAGSAGRLVEGIGNAQLGDHMEAPRQDIAPGDAHDRSERIGRARDAGLGIDPR